MHSTRALTYSLAALLITSVCAAQDSTETRNSASALAQRLSYGLTFMQSRPQGELARRVGLGYGANGSVLFRLDDKGWLSLRGDIGAVQYGDASREVDLGDPQIDGLRFRVNTTNYIMPIGLGAQVTLPSGLVRPYLNAGVAAQVFFTETELRSDRAGSNIASTTNRSDGVASMMVGGGLYFVLPIRSRSVLIDAGVQYLDGGRASYLVPTATNDATGRPSFVGVSSGAHLMVIKLGARIGW